jgi:hypothetical protein
MSARNVRRSVPLSTSPVTHLIAVVPVTLIRVYWAQINDHVSPPVRTGPFPTLGDFAWNRPDSDENQCAGGLDQKNRPAKQLSEQIPRCHGYRL